MLDLGFYELLVLQVFLTRWLDHRNQVRRFWLTKVLVFLFKNRVRLNFKKFWFHDNWCWKFLVWAGFRYEKWFGRLLLFLVFFPLYPICIFNSWLNIRYIFTWRCFVWVLWEVVIFWEGLGWAAFEILFFIFAYYLLWALSTFLISLRGILTNNVIKKSSNIVHFCLTNLLFKDICLF